MVMETELEIKYKKSDEVKNGEKMMNTRFGEFGGQYIPEILMSEINHVAEAYETVCDEENKEKLKELLVDHEVDIITFTSSSTVFNLVDQLDGETGLLDGVSLACIGSITADACRKYGLEPQIISDTFTIDGLTEAIVKGVAKE